MISPTTHVSSLPVAASTGWTTYHKDGSRNGYDGNAPFFPPSGVPNAVWQTAALDGSNQAEPLAYGGVIFQATENNSIYALNETNGSQVWYWHKYASVPNPASPCGNINPVGITSTPVIDPALGLIYAVGLVSAGAGIDKWQLFTVNISTGIEAFPPVDITTTGLDPVVDEQRAALAIAPTGLTVYVAFGGWIGDCGNYHPWVIGVPVGTSRGNALMVYQPQTGSQAKAGIWGASGPAVDAAGNVYVDTGNGTENNCSNAWDHSEAVIKLSPSLAELSTFAPTNWCSLNAADSDIGSLGPLLLQNTGEVFATGKPGDWYLLNGAALGGIGGQMSTAHVDSCPTSDAVFGGLAYFAPYVYVPCDTTGLVALKENTAVTPHTFSVAWQSSSFTPSAPIVAGGVVWTMSSSSLEGFDAVSGASRFSVSIGGHNRFSTPTEDNGWLIVPESNRVHAFSFGAAVTSFGYGGHLASGPAATSSSATREDVFVAGVDNAAWTATLTEPAGTFSGWSSLGGSIRHDPTASTSSATKQDLYVVGADGGLWTVTWNGTSWGSVYRPLYGHITSSPEAAAGAALNRIDIFVVGVDGALWQSTTADGGTTYGQWTSLNGHINASPGAVSSAAGSLDVAVQGIDGALWLNHWNGTSWSGWTTQFGHLVSSPELASCAAGHLDVFVVGLDGALWQNGFNGGAWSGWHSYGGHWNSDFGATCRKGTTTVEDVYGRAVDGSMWAVSATAS